MTDSSCLNGADAMVLTYVGCEVLCFECLERAKWRSLYCCFPLLRSQALSAVPELVISSHNCPLLWLTMFLHVRQPPDVQKPLVMRACVRLWLCQLGVNVRLCPWIVRTQGGSGCRESVLLPKEAACLLIVPFLCHCVLIVELILVEMSFVVSLLIWSTRRGDVTEVGE